MSRNLGQMSFIWGCEVPQVDYGHGYDYTYDLTGKLYPRLLLRVTSPASDSGVDLYGYLDSGAERSLFSGWVGAALGIDILGGPKITYETAAGTQMIGNLHQVCLHHTDLGTFELEVGFSTSDIRRDILGRDFFNLIQVGFRENQLVFFINPEP
jgi:hypothetical protein